MRELVFAFLTDEVLANFPEFRDRDPAEIGRHEPLVCHGRVRWERLESAKFRDGEGHPRRWDCSRVAFDAFNFFVRHRKLLIACKLLRGAHLDCRTVPSVACRNGMQRTRRAHGARIAQEFDAFAFQALNMNSRPNRRAGPLRRLEKWFPCARGDSESQGLGLVDGTIRSRAANSSADPLP